MRGRLGSAASLLYPLMVLLLLRSFGARLPSAAAQLLKLYPAAVNGVLLGIFSFSLLKPPNFVERIARIRDPFLPPRAVAYTRTVTKVWCLFFILNGLTSLATVFWASDAVWALYNGVIAYALMGALMGIEWLVRSRARLHEPA